MSYYAITLISIIGIQLGLIIWCSILTLINRHVPRYIQPISLLLTVIGLLTLFFYLLDLN